ncbi:uncharacterized protein LOC107763692 [Nicotiana tabacum]|uniref:Uncharacterized protein n=7 Tax=Nicotiana TaxID=4085 RepID=A0A1S3XD38_TOBAC|nr:PREDICTED: uncharacterized protein LOC104211754 isoform X2 [Nicotiana sylvestris]XP_009759180.1 PREDICTED: uncharacterized protein LOC104211754 isoform X2 [Nicotiana sylvestris]XP_009759186.1 PREDICTED: uncharacterized protein LOC104211754 isoform X2 [Nicotiana sylvestris]XP_016437665.1 PREDICTED: uncharacterized protein LOC107763692 [Nicotiana tabacum]XP_016437666.1 PREDICTED: uncharacterized protein LOC107763692 [Nicotiana tabacum]XP_016437667.1 PREDICTED: uncharacterized protein LOC10776
MEKSYCYCLNLQLQLTLHCLIDATDERMQQKMEEMEERMEQRMLEKFNAQKDAMEQEITVNVVARLQRLNPDLQLDPNMLMFSARASGEVFSTQQAAIQLINRPTACSYNQGGVDQEMEDGGNEDLEGQ